MRTSTLFFLWIVVCGLTESSGSVGGGSEKCLCKGKLLKDVKNKLIKVGPVVHPKSIFCTKIEIIFTLKTEIKKCLDPNSRQGKRLINRFIHGNLGQTNQQRRPKTNKIRKQRRRTGNSHV